MAERQLGSFLHVRAGLTFFFSLPSCHPPLFHSHKYALHAPTHTNLVDSKALRQLEHTHGRTHTSASVNHLSPGGGSRKPQSKSCWQEAAALHLSVKVSVNTMCLSSALSSLLTSVLTLTYPLRPSVLSISYIADSFYILFFLYCGSTFSQIRNCSYSLFGCM